MLISPLMKCRVMEEPTSDCLVRGNWWAWERDEAIAISWQRDPGGWAWA